MEKSGKSRTRYIGEGWKRHVSREWGFWPDAIEVLEEELDGAVTTSARFRVAGHEWRWTESPDSIEKIA